MFSFAKYNHQMDTLPTFTSSTPQVKQVENSLRDGIYIYYELLQAFTCYECFDYFLR